MKPRYNELLPSYLDGPNIQKHGEIIDSSTDKIYNKNYLLEQWNNIPNRPILIRKIQEHGNAADIKVYCNSSYALKNISITGDYEANVEFSEEDVVTSYTFNIRILKSALTGETLEFAEETGIINPNLTVTMEDYDQHTIQKAYPENDSIENNPLDHDPFLDIIGGLLTVKRRTYITYENTSENTAKTYPAYFGKKLENNMISVCTEDDYYYLQRILYFIEKNGTEDIAKTMLKIVYELDCDVLNYNEDICKMDIHDMDEKYMADNTSQDVNTASYRIVPVWYSNITHPNEEELNQFIKPYLPVTRKVITTWKENVLITFEGIQERYCENGSFTILVTDEEEEPITGLPLELHYGGLPEQVVTDENGEYLFEFGYPTEGGGALTVISQETDNYQSASNSCTYNVQKKTRTINYLSTETEVTPQGVLTISASIRTAGSGRLSTNANGTITYSENNVVLAELDVVNGEITDFTINLSPGTHTILAHADLTYAGCTDGTRSINESITAIVPVERTVFLETEVISATNDGITVDVTFWNGEQTAFIQLDGTITMSINDGTSTTVLDTQTLLDVDGVTLSSPSGSTFQDGTYTLSFELNAINPPSGYYYNNPITASETITISSRTIIDCTTTSAWIRNNERTTTTAVLDTDGYITSDRGGSDYFTVCNDLVLTRGMTIEIDFMMKNSGMHGYGLQQIISNSPNKIFTFNGTIEEKHSGGTQTTQTGTTIPTNTLTRIKYTIDNNGYITITDYNGTTRTSNSAFTDLELAQMQLCWKHWGTDKSFSIRRLVYTGGGGGRTRIFDWCDTLTNWKSTSGSTYLPEITTLEDLTGVKAPQNTRNMSYHMSYFDQALRLDEDTVIRCEVQCGALQNLYELGIITKDNINNPYQYRTWAVFFITRTDHKIDNLDGNAVACNTPAVATWFPVYFIIHNRSITVIFNDANDTLGIHTTTVNNVSSDDTKNNNCYLGMHSAESSYPLAAIRSVSIVKLNTSQ